MKSPDTADGERVLEALKIADASADDVKTLDFGNVFWACGVLAKAIRALQPAQPAVHENPVCPTCKGSRLHCDCDWKRYNAEKPQPTAEVAEAPTCKDYLQVQNLIKRIDFALKKGGASKNTSLPVDIFILQALIQAAQQSAGVEATSDEIRAGFIIWNFDTKMNDLLWHITNYYKVTLKDCEVCENTGRVEANEEGTEFIDCSDCPRANAQKYANKPVLIVGE